MIKAVVFSKDRAMQLALLLDSIRRNAPGLFEIAVLYASSSPEFEKGYEALIADTTQDRIDWVPERDFKRDLWRILHGSLELTCFLTDDDIVFKPVREADIVSALSDEDVLCFSMRLGRNTTVGYAMRALNGLFEAEDVNGQIKFDWSIQQGDYAYPFSLDGHVFRTDEIIRLTNAVRFSNPNTYESNLLAFARHPGVFKGHPRAKVAAYQHSALVGVPVNQVQSVFENRHGEAFSFPVSELNRQFLAGDRIDFESLDLTDIKGCHQELEYKFKRMPKGDGRQNAGREPRRAKPTDVSVLMPTFNGARTIERAIRSVLDQSYRSLEVLVVDDASTDRTVDIASEIARTDARVRVLSNPHGPSGGPAIPRNIGLAAATGEFIALLDQDDYWLPGKLELQLAALRRTEADLAYGRVWVEDNQGNRVDYHVRWGLWDKGTLPAEDMAEKLAAQNVIPALTVVFKQSLWPRLGGFIPEVAGAEDWLFWLRAAAAECRFVALEEHLAVYSWSGDNLSTRKSLRMAGHWVGVLEFMLAMHPDQHHLFSQPLKALLRNFGREAARSEGAPLPDPRAREPIDRDLEELRGWAEELRRNQKHLRDAAALAQDRLDELRAAALDREIALGESLELAGAEKVRADRLETALTESQRAVERAREALAGVERASFVEKTHFDERLQNERSRRASVAEALRVERDRVRSAETRLEMFAEELRAIREATQTQVLAQRMERERVRRVLHGIAFATGQLARRPGKLRALREVGTALRLRFEREPSAVWGRYFDVTAYYRENPDVAASNVPAWLHYFFLGHKEGRQPGVAFDGTSYLERNPDVAAAGLNPLAHFAISGAREGREAPPVARRPVETEPGESRLKPKAGAGQGRPKNPPWPSNLPLVSVVIPCFNYGRYLGDAIESVLAQTWADLEIIVVEGGSTDPATVAEARRLEARGHPRVRFLYRGKPHQVGDNRNFGIGQARGRYVCCLDADDLLDPTYLEVATFLAETGDLGVVYPSVQCFGESDMVWWAAEARFPQIASENVVSTVALFRRSAWAEVGGYRDWGFGEDYVYEDWEFWVRLLGQGQRSKNIRKPLMRYRVHGEGLTRAAPDMAHHAARIKAANSLLIRNSEGADDQPERAILDALCNLTDPARAPGPRESILLALPYVSTGGAEHLLSSLAEVLVKKGHRVLVTTSIGLPDDTKDASIVFQRVTPHVYDLVQLFSEDALRSRFLLYLIDRYRVGTVVVAGSRLVYDLLPAIREGHPQIAVVDQLFNDVGHIQSNRLYRKEIDLTIVPSTVVSDTLVHGHHESESRVRTIPHGIPIHAPPADPISGPSDRPVVAFFGRMSDEKAPHAFVDIALEIARSTDARFIMTGDGPLRREVLERISAYQLDDRFFAPGVVDDVRPLMRQADVVVIPSKLDGMPLVALEALSIGKAVVASAVGSLPKVIRDGETGFLCQPGDIAGFARRIAELLGDEPLRRRIGEKGRALVLSEYTIDVMADRYLRAFEAARESALRRLIDGPA